MSYPKRYLEEVQTIAKSIDVAKIEAMIEILVQVREAGGRLFFLGVGGSAANCTHAVNDFRKIANIETYSPVDNVAELTARTNDEGWDTVFTGFLQVSRVSSKDVIFVLSVGGGSDEKGVSVNLVRGVQLAKSRGAKVIAIVGRDGGYTAKVADACVIIPTQSSDTITPHAEAWQGVIWHMIVSDPRIMRMSNKWESLEAKTSAQKGDQQWQSC